MARTKRGGGPNKMALVRDAIAALGGNAKPKALHEQIKEAAGVDIPTGMISSYKSMITKKGKRGRKKKGRGPGRPPKSAGGGGGGGGGSVSFSDVAAVKSLVSKLGAKKISDIIHLLS